MRTSFLLAALVLCPAPVGAQELGRLFFTPEQRANLDARRKARVPDKPAAVSISPNTRIDGYVERSGGPATVWVNGEPVPEQAPEAPRIDTPATGEGRVSISTGEGGGRIRLKPGQTIDRASGEVRDVLGDGEISVRRKPQ
jgi:hypothetical protein